MRRLAVTACLVALCTVVTAAASAATPVSKATVGPGFKIKVLNPPTKPGKVRLVVADLSSEHNFHLTGPGVNVTTTLGGTGTRTFTVTLQRGTYTYVCDPHKSFMKGSFTIR